MSLPLWERGLKFHQLINLLCVLTLSLPLWERGLKSKRSNVSTNQQTVAPLVGAWIEIIFMVHVMLIPARSLPLWERGLKYTIKVFKSMLIIVAPLVGAWIEIHDAVGILDGNECRSPCGSVD